MMDSQSRVFEPPLQRPVQLPADESRFEAPLERPVEAPPDLPFDQCNMFFAVDVSGSTAGLVLAEERAALETIADHLPSQTKAKCRVGPWNDVAQPLLQLDELDELDFNGRTRPRVLLENPQHLKAVTESQLWFLFTDGEIDEPEVRNFAASIDEHCVHNRACVLIIFGYRGRMPALCNISVGVALFGMASDAVFLFHDIETEELFIFQAKGCFGYLRGPAQREIILEQSTRWDELPTTNYEALFASRIPLPRALNKNEIVLQDGTRLDLDRIAKDNLCASDAEALLDNGTDLNAIMVSMRCRGRAGEAKRWVQNRKVALATQIKDRIRIDVGNHAESALCAVMDSLRNPDDLQTTLRMQSRLRNAHAANWLRLIQDQRAQQVRTEMARDCLHRMSLAEDYSYSPTSLTPSHSLQPAHSGHMGPQTSAPVTGTIGVDASGRPATPVVYDGSKSSEPEKSEVKPRRKAKSLISRFSGDKANRYETKPTDQGTESLSRSDLLEIENLREEITFCPGLSIPKGYPLQTLPFLTCPLCGESTVHFAILLKEVPEGTFTPGFPSPKSVCEVLYPLALALYRETDIIARTGCCEVCAYHLVKTKSSLHGEQIVAALPIVPPLVLRDNKQRWLNTLDAALEERFERRNLLAIFLAITTEALEHAKRDPTHQLDVLQEILPHVCQQLKDECRISFDGRLGTIDQAVQAYFSSTEPTFTNGVLKHPIESFTTIVANTTMIGRAMKVRILFMRFVLLVFSKFTEVSGPVTTTTALATAYLKLLKEDRAAVSGTGTDTPGYLTPSTTGHNSRRAVTVDDLIAYSLITAQDLATLKILGPIWHEVENDAEPALYLCLLKLAHEKTKPSSAAIMLERWRTRGGLEEVFTNPTGVTDDMIDDLMIR
jgi:hypothetical protein